MERQDTNQSTRESESLTGDFQSLNLCASSSNNQSSSGSSLETAFKPYVLFPDSNRQKNFDRDRLYSICHDLSQTLGDLTTWMPIDYSSVSRHIANYAFDANSICSSRVGGSVHNESLCTIDQDTLRGSKYDDIVGRICAIVQDGETLVRAALDRNGIEFVKKLIDIVKSDELCELVTSALRANVHELMQDRIGCKLVSHCLRNLSYSQNSFIFDAAAKNCIQLAKNETAYLSLIECIRLSTSPQRVLHKIAHNSLMLATHSKGNFVLQCVLGMGDPIVNQEICSRLESHLKDLAMNQRGSYVIQRCLETFGGECLIRRLASFDAKTLERLATDVCGNYVLQTALETDKGTELQDQLMYAIRQLPIELKNDFYAANVFRIVESLEQERARFEG